MTMKILGIAASLLAAIPAVAQVRFAQRDFSVTFHAMNVGVKDHVVENSPTPPQNLANFSPPSLFTLLFDSKSDGVSDNIPLPNQRAFIWKNFAYTASFGTQIRSEDKDFIEVIAYTKFSAPVTDAQLQDQLLSVIHGFGSLREDPRTDATGFHPAEYKARLVSKRPIYSVDKHRGMEATVNNVDGNNAYFRILAVGNRMYTLMVISDATEEPDDPKCTHAIEKERFFNSLVLARQGKKELQKSNAAKKG